MATYILLSDFARSRYRFGGSGYIAGIAPGLLTINGAAASREIEIRHRATRGVLETLWSGSDGSYLALDLDPNDVYDVISRDWSGTYNDIIVSRVRPEPYDVQSVTGAFVANSAADTLDGALDVVGGMDPYTVTVTSGAAPPGLMFSVIVGTTPVFAATGRYVVASGTTVAGAYSWDLTITTANGSSQTIACSATFT